MSRVASVDFLAGLAQWKSAPRLLKTTRRRGTPTTSKILRALSSTGEFLICIQRMRIRFPQGPPFTGGLVNGRPAVLHAACVGSIPTPPTSLCKCRSKAGPQISNLMMRVRFSSLVPVYALVAQWQTRLLEVQVVEGSSPFESTAPW